MDGPRPLIDKPSPHLSIDVVSPAKYGKTSSLITLPKPHLLVDCDGGIESLFREDRITPEQRDGVFIVQPKCYADLLSCVTTLWKEGPEGKPFISMSIDTFSWGMSNIVKPEILARGGREKMELQDWGLYLERGMVLARKAHEIAMDDDGCHVVLTFHEADKGGGDGEIGKLGPSVQGQLFDILPGIPNYVFFMRILRTGKFDPKTKMPIMRRVFLTEADARTPAGSRRKLEMHEEPDFSAIWEKVRPKNGSKG